TLLQRHEVLKNTVLIPIGIEGDNTGIVRAMFLGFRDIYIARNAGTATVFENLDEPMRNFVAETLKAYKQFIEDVSKGELTETELGQLRTDLSKLREQHILDLAVSTNINRVPEALAIFAMLLPIRPVNPELLRQIYERAKALVLAAA
ncbi:MAG: hypothetical protein PHS37_03350, partial [Candidatus Omnitrophica bacterium]|nr:hypothetical protein [Candidatus Omnitrophota bacterium]